MVHNPVVVAALSAALLAPLAAGMYSSNSPVLQVNSKNFAEKILKSNHASIVEFYAPWCGHCKNLKPGYEKAAENMKGLAQVAAIDCDDDKNRATCSEHGIQGFPTLKLFKPGKNGKPVIQDYQGQRTAKAIVDFLVDNIPNHVARVNSKTVEEFLQKNNETTKAVLFSKKGIASPLYKALSIDFLGSVTFAQVRDKETEVLELFGVTKLPSFIVLPGGTAEGVVYDGEMKKDNMVKFISKFAKPTAGKPASPSTPPKEEKKEKKTETSSSSAAPSAPPKETFIAAIPQAPSLEIFTETCGKKICVLVVVPENAPDLTAFEKTNVYVNMARRTFPFFQVRLTTLSPDFRTAFGIEAADHVQMVAMNSKKGWYASYKGHHDSHEDMKLWIDAVKMGEVQKSTIPPFSETAKEAPSAETPAKEDPIKEATREEEPAKEAPKEEKPPKKAPEHEEL